MNKQTATSYSQQLDIYTNAIQKIQKKYMPKKSSIISISFDTDIADLPFSRRIINRLVYGANIKTVRDLLYHYQYDGLRNVNQLGEKSIQTIQKFIEDNLSSLGHESITNLYYKKLQEAMSIIKDLENLNNIYTSLSEYSSTLDSDSEADLSAKRDIRLLFNRINELLKNCNSIFLYIDNRINALKEDYRRISIRSTNGEFIESSLRTTLDGISKSDSSTELRQQFEKYKSIVDGIRAKYIGSLPINLGTNIRELHFIDSQNANSRLINILEQYSVLADTGFSDDNYKRIFTVIDLLLLYTSNNDAIGLVCDKYARKTRSGLSRNSIDQIENFINTNLIPLLFNKDIISKYYNKSEENNVLLNDINTIINIYNNLLLFRQNLSIETKLDDSELYTDGSNILNNLTDPKLRIELNKKALYRSHVKDLISDSKTLLYLLDKIKECLDMAIKPQSNETVIKHMKDLQSDNDSKTLGGECHWKNI